MPEMETFVKCSQIAVETMLPGFETQSNLTAKIIGDAMIKTMITDESIESILDSLEQELKSELE